MQLCKPDPRFSSLLLQLARSESAGRRRYAEFVAQGRGVRLWDEALTGQIYLGDERFVERLKSKRESRQDSREIPRAQRRGRALPLEQYLRERTGVRRGSCEPIARVAIRRARSPRRWVCPFRGSAA